MALWEKKPRTGTPETPKLDLTPSAGPLPAETPSPKPAPEPSRMERPMPDTPAPRTTPSPVTSQGASTLGRSMVLKGELTGKEDLTVEGQFEGTIDVAENTVTVGAQGQVKSEIRARHVIVHGSVSGKIAAREKIDIRRTGNVTGDLVASGVAIEDGAYFKGSIEILREGKSETPQSAVREPAGPRSQTAPGR
jgi:cytoskeletal protein CcmA (bactofilin family)